MLKCRSIGGAPWKQELQELCLVSKTNTDVIHRSTRSQPSRKQHQNWRRIINLKLGVTAVQTQWLGAKQMKPRETQGCERTRSFKKRACLVLVSTGNSTDFPVPGIPTMSGVQSVKSDDWRIS